MNHRDVLKPILIAGLLVPLVMLNSCSTKKNTFTRRAYHNLTAHYNAYFNGNEAIKEGVTELSRQNKDNFTKVIPVFALGTKSDAQAVFALMDRAIEKGSIVISRHSIYIRHTEHVKWIDDAYLMIGKAHYYKQDYQMANQAFAFIKDRFKYADIYYDAVIWKARTLIQMERLPEAETELLAIEDKMGRDNALRSAEKMYPLVWAELSLKKGDYNAATEYLLQGLRLNKGRKVGTRIMFILAQLFQRTGNLPKATEYYKNVLSRSTPYDMEFAAKINLAKCYDAASGDKRTILKLLNRMLRDDKNKEFRDQIYYALAEVSIKDNDEEQAIKYYQLSARTSVSNDYQKGVSYLSLAEIFYERPSYKPAQMYYDSAVMVLPKDFPNLSQIESRKVTLTDLVNNLNVVELEDSLQGLARMSPGERMEIINKVIQDLNKEEERLRQEELDRQITLNNLQQMNQNNQSLGGQWYFYNPQSLSFGYTEFSKKWGTRKMEDLWRLSSKQLINFGIDENFNDLDSLQNDSAKLSFNPKDPNSYLKQIPTTPEMIKKSNAKIIDALYNIGYIYKEGLGDYPRSIDAFNRLLQRFPDNKYLLQTYYNLYRIYEDNENTSQAEFYKNLIVTGYPDSDYAHIISDPDYYLKLKAQSDLVETFYKETYLDYTAGNYGQVLINADSALRTYVDKDLLSRFAFLRALSIGKTQTNIAFKSSLESVVANYPDSKVKPRAQAILDLLNATSDGGNPPVTDTSEQVIKDEDLYQFDPATFHFYILVMDAKEVIINNVKVAFSNHNTKMFSLNKLNINTLFLDDKRHVLNVSRFDNKDKAMEYFNSVNSSRDILSVIVSSNYSHFIISANNYATFYKSKDVDLYLKFFNENYIGN